MTKVVLQSFFLLFVSLAAASGCASYTVTPARTGALYPSKGDVCAIRFENLNYQEASSRYQNLGLISVSGASSAEFTDDMKKDVERSACHMGADAVSLNVSVQGSFQFLVWRAK